YDQHRQAAQRFQFSRLCPIHMLDRKVRGEMKSTSAPGLAVELDLATHQVDQLRCNRQSQSGAAELARRRGIDLAECLKNPSLFVLRNAEAGIANGESQSSKVATYQFRRHLHEDFSCLRELDRVANQINDHLTQPPRIAPQVVGDVWPNMHGQLQALFRSAIGEQVQSFAQGVAKTKRNFLQLQLPGFNF